LAKRQCEAEIDLDRRAAKTRRSNAPKIGARPDRLPRGKRAIGARNNKLNERV
jgi:hypothetical protein